jgi:hypothetical protein
VDEAVSLVASVRAFAPVGKDVGVLMLPKDWKVVFLATLAKTGNVRMSADLAGVCYLTAYRYRELNGGFAAEWDCARGRFLAARKSVLRRRWASELQQAAG